jgi:hypothetical protein
LFRQIRTDVEKIDNWHALGEKIQGLVEQQKDINEALPEVCFFATRNCSFQ